jgi:inorganic pyrophosphatase/exopolyphosphatase
LSVEEIYFQDYKHFKYKRLGNTGYAIVNIPPEKFFKKIETGLVEETKEFIKENSLDVFVICFKFLASTTPNISFNR